MIHLETELKFMNKVLSGHEMKIIIILLLIFTGCSKRHSAEDILGTSLPSSAKDIQISDKISFFGGDSYLTATITKEDFNELTARLKLNYKADLISLWPSALEAHDVSWWSVSKLNDTNTLFGEEPSTYLIARYEGGKLYFKRHVY